MSQQRLRDEFVRITIRIGPKVSDQLVDPEYVAFDRNVANTPIFEKPAAKIVQLAAN